MATLVYHSIWIMYLMSDLKAHYDILGLIGVVPSQGLWAGQPGLDDQPELQHGRCNIKIYIHIQSACLKAFSSSKSCRQGGMRRCRFHPNFFVFLPSATHSPPRERSKVFTNLCNKRREGKAWCLELLQTLYVSSFGSCGCFRVEPDVVASIAPDVVSSTVLRQMLSLLLLRLLSLLLLQLLSLLLLQLLPLLFLLFWLLLLRLLKLLQQLAVATAVSPGVSLAETPAVTSFSGL